MGTSAFRTFVERLLPQRRLTISPIEIFGSALAIGILLFLSNLSVAAFGDPLFVAPLAASIAIIFVDAKMTVSRTWNVVAGQFLSAAVALGVVVLIGEYLEVTAMVVIALALLVMRAARCLHPPACATALIIVVSPEVQHPVFLFLPVLVGALVVVSVAWGVHFFEARFPSRWGRYEMQQRRTGG
jgi:CBS domain-containing membrane protein